MAIDNDLVKLSSAINLNVQMDMAMIMNRVIYINGY